MTIEQPANIAEVFGMLLVAITLIFLTVVCGELGTRKGAQK